MIYFDLLLCFLKIGLFSFGGAYGSIPLIRDEVLSYGWLDEEVLTYMIAVSESTPGPIMVNLATYIGSSQAGLFGAALATFAVVLPAFLIILLVMEVLKTMLKSSGVQAALAGLKPCITGIVLATGIYMVLSNCLFLPKVLNAEDWQVMAQGRAGMENYWKDVANVHGMAVTLLSGGALLGYRFLFKKKLSPIMLIGISACLGILIFR